MPTPTPPRCSITSYKVRTADIAPGTYRSLTGNHAAALGFVAASELAGMCRCSSAATRSPRPPTSCTSCRRKFKHYNVTTFQAEDEIAGICSAIGAAYGGVLGMTTTSGPGMALKTEALGLGRHAGDPAGDRKRPARRPVHRSADQDRAVGPAAGGVRQERRVPDPGHRRANSPADSFYAAVEALKVATRYMVPVMLLSDGYIANGSEPWPVPDVTKLDRFDVNHPSEPAGYHVYQRDPATLARAWAIPGTAGFEHRIGGIEKDSLTGNISYAPDNHERMIHTRADKVARVAQEIGELDLRGEDSGDVLLIGWGGTYGSLRQATNELRAQGRRVSHAHLRWLSPLEPGLDAIIRNFKHVVCAELNLGQLRALLRAKYLIDVVGLNKVQGLPFKVREVVAALEQLLDGATVLDINVPTSPTARA
jgi:2-oxoglutarate ferredoxin oxidoreductase subunit alpha